MGNLAELEALVIETVLGRPRTGVDTRVDLTTMNLGRNLEMAARVARATGMTIVAATGFWLDIPRMVRFFDAEAIEDLVVRELTEGVRPTGIRAGVIKVASDCEGVTDAAKTVLIAAARGGSHRGPHARPQLCAGPGGRSAGIRAGAGGSGSHPRDHRPRQRRHGCGIPHRTSWARLQSRTGPISGADRARRQCPRPACPGPFGSGLRPPARPLP